MLAFMLSALVLTETVQVWHIYLLSFCLGILTAVDMPAQQAFLGDLAGMQIVRQAVNLNVTILQTSRIIGPAIAGVIIGIVGAGLTFLLNGLSFLAVILSLTLVRAAQVQSKGSGQSAIRGFRTTLEFLNSQPRLRDCIFFVMMVTFFGFSIIITILPAVASEVLKGDASTLGLLMSSSGFGSLVGTVIVAPLVQQYKRTGMALAYAAIFGAAALCGLGMTTFLPVALAALFSAGLAFPAVMTTVIGILQVNAPPTIRARVMSLFTMVSFGLQPVASLWIGWSAEHFGIQQAIILNGLALMTGATLMISRVHLRQWQTGQDHPFVEPVPAEG
jgi:MFS family permease